VKTRRTFTQTRHLRRRATRRRLNLAPLFALLTLGAIGAALVVLFPMDWVRTAGVTANVEYSVFSPNNDGQRDVAYLQYALTTDAVVTVRVLDEHKGLVRTLINEQAQVAGRHTVTWDGLDSLGQPVADGKYYFQIIARATARETVTSVPIYVDTKPPIIRLANLPEDMEVGGNTRELIIEGVTDPDATVWLNDLYQPIPVDEDGSFRIRYRLQEGVNRIEIRAVDEAGNQSSVVREVTLITQPPELIVTNPPDELWINQAMLSVQGKVPPGVTVRVNGKEVQVDEDGAFNVDIVLDEGENVIRVEAIDPVGNVSVEERRVFLRTRPPQLALTNVQDGMTVREPSIIVIGRTEPGVSVWVNGRQVAVDAQGGFQAPVELIAGENVIRVEAIDKAGNSATLVRRIVYEPVTATQKAEVPARDWQPIFTWTAIGLAGLLLAWLAASLWQRPLTLVLRAERPVLYRDSTGLTAPAVIAFEISRPATVVAQVWDEQDNPVATLGRRQRRSRGEHLLVWNGKTDAGKPAPPGAYEIEVHASTLFNTVSSSVRVWIQEEGLAPEVLTQAEASSRVQNVDLGARGDRERG